jgi:hypothetical protein
MRLWRIKELMPMEGNAISKSPSIPLFKKGGGFLFPPFFYKGEVEGILK